MTAKLLVCTKAAWKFLEDTVVSDLPRSDKPGTLLSRVKTAFEFSEKPWLTNTPLHEPYLLELLLVVHSV